jgi:hypothetical protein
VREPVVTHTTHAAAIVDDRRHGTEDSAHASSLEWCASIVLKSRHLNQSEGIVALRVRLSGFS